MPRIELFDPAAMTDDQRAVYEAVVAGPRGEIVGPLRAVLRLPRMADLWQRFGAHIRFDLSLPKRTSELAILVTARHWTSQVEWQIHARAARAAGISPAVIDALRSGRLPPFDRDEDRHTYEFARALLADGDVSDAVHAKVCDHWGETGAIELTAVIGYYSMVALMLNAHAIPRQPTDEPALDPIATGLPPHRAA